MPGEPEATRGELATANTAVLFRRAALRKPQEHDRRLLLGLEAHEDDGLGLLEVGVGHRSPSGPVAATTEEARKSASSAECGRARKSMLLVSRTARANLPAASGGHLAADEHADAPGRLEAGGRCGERLRPGRDLQLALLVADHGAT